MVSGKNENTPPIALELRDCEASHLSVMIYGISLGLKTLLDLSSSCDYPCWASFRFEWRRIGIQTGGWTWKSRWPISSSTLLITVLLQGSRVMTNGSLECG